MGLDMYAYTINQELVGDQQIEVNFPEALGATDKTNYDTVLNKAIQDGVYNTEFAYWRKFNNLHGWMENLYRTKGGTKEFNCVNVRLMPKDIDRLEQERSNLEPFSGFFFGVSEPMDQDSVDEIIVFIFKCRLVFNEGKAVFYDSWW